MQEKKKKGISVVASERGAEKGTVPREMSVTPTDGGEIKPDTSRFVFSVCFHYEVEARTAKIPKHHLFFLFFLFFISNI